MHRSGSLIRNIVGALAIGALLLAAQGLFMAAPEAAPTSSSWPGFRGPRVDGSAEAGGVFADKAQVALNTAWKVPLGSGYSGVAVAAGHVISMGAAGDSDRVLAVDASTGETLWTYNLGPTYVGHDGSHDGPLSTPFIADNTVFVLSAHGRLAALRLKDGTPAWSVELQETHEAKKPYYGFATSPLLVGGVLIIQGGAKDAAVAGFDPKTGELLWQAGEDNIGYQSPVPLEKDGRITLLVAGSKKLLGIDPASGKTLWEYEHGGDGARGAASLVPVPAGDGRLFLAHKDDGSALVRLATSDGVVAVDSLWEGRTIRNSYNVPVYHEGYIYAFSSRFLTCVDASSGESKWRSRLPGDGFLILVDDHLVVVTKSGTVHVAAASPEAYTEIGSLPVFSDLAWSPPSYAGGSVYLRSLAELARVDLNRGAAPAGAAASLAKPATAFARAMAGIRDAENPGAAADAFMAKVESFPILEEPDLVHFIYRGSGTDLAVASDLFGARQEKSMARVAGTDLFTYSARLEPDGRVNYMFMRDYEEMLDPLNPRKATTRVVGKDMEMSFGGPGMEMSWFAMKGWQEPAYLQESPAERRGRLEAGELESQALETKVPYQVYLPVGYEQGQERYGVAYIHAGAGAREHGGLPNSLDNLIGSQVAPVIVVFVEHPRAQANDAYLKMINEELIPAVDAAYRTRAEATSRAHVGMGFAGFAAIYCAMKEPGVADMMAAQSSFLFGTAMPTVTEMMTSAAERPLQIYLDWGKYDLRNPHEAWDIGEMNQELNALFEAHGYQPAGGEAHDGMGWPSWKNRTGALFAALFPLVE